MVRLPFAVRAAFFRSALDDIFAAYRAAANAHVKRPEEIEAEVRRRLNMGPDDLFPDRGNEDIEDLISQLYDEAGELEEQAWRGARLVRKAFLIALFHHWERYCNSELGKTKYHHPKAWLTNRGKGACAAEILELELAANCAKHGPGRSCRNLYNKSHQLFPSVSIAEKASEQSLVIDEPTLERFFEVVRAAAS